MQLIKPQHGVIFHSNGLIELTKEVTTALGLKQGDYVNFEQTGCELYIHKSTQGAKLKSKTKDAGFLRCNNASVTRLILGTAHLGKYPLGETTIVDGKKMLCIIYKNNYAK